jgi:hypothetical protein
MPQRKVITPNNGNLIDIDTNKNSTLLIGVAFRTSGSDYFGVQDSECCVKGASAQNLFPGLHTKPNRNYEKSQFPAFILPIRVGATPPHLRCLGYPAAYQG